MKAFDTSFLLDAKFLIFPQKKIETVIQKFFLQ